MCYLAALHLTFELAFVIKLKQNFLRAEKFKIAKNFLFINKRDWYIIIFSFELFARIYFEITDFLFSLFLIYIFISSFN